LIDTPQLASEPEDAPEQQDALAMVSGPALRLAAVEELEDQLAHGSPRSQRLAGIALARIAHKQALALLHDILKTENSDLSRIDIAYGLALGKQDEGRSYLVAELKNKRRDVRIDAARRLVQLGDDAGRNTLVQMLGIKSHRLGAATELAQLQDERGVEALRETFEDASSSEENKMRAAVGLGRAGDKIASDYLKKILSEGRYVVDAAGALAVLGEEEARPALMRQLELTSMRVRAAGSLKSMGEEIDLAPLAAALKTGSTDGRIGAAEAILLLTDAGESN
jgi:HEAT repeat protein